MIAHVDADSFFASVLTRKHPSLKGKPLLALGMGGGFVIAASYEAKAKGIRTGMRLTDALKLAPNALHMPADFRETGLASQQMEAILESHCPVIEQFSIDEWFLDLKSVVGGVPKNLLAWAKAIQKEIVKKTAITVSIGIAPSKVLAKMASEYHKPSGIAVVTEHAPPHLPHSTFHIPLQQFLQDRPAEAIPGIGRRTEPKVAPLGYKTAWDIACAPTDIMIRILGRPGHDLQRELRGEAVSAVKAESDPPKSISRCRSFKLQRDPAVLWAQIIEHLQITVLKMRRQELACRALTVWLRDGEYEHEGGNLRLPQPLTTEEQLQPYVRLCFQAALREGSACAYTQAGLCLADLCSAHAGQFSLFRSPEDDAKEEQVQGSLDKIRDRFGRDIITRGAALRGGKALRPSFGFSFLDSQKE